MDKFIDKQIRKHSFQYIMGSPTRVLTEADCKMLIEKFCKAQAKACLRAYKSNALKAHGFGTMQNIIENAQIIESDYDDD